MGITICHHFGVGQRPQDVIGPRFCAEASDQPGTLWITNRRESVDQPAFLPNAGLEEGGDKLRGLERCPHYPQAALCGLAVRSPHLRAEVDHVGRSRDDGAAPRTGLLAIESDACAPRHHLTQPTHSCA